MRNVPPTTANYTQRAGRVGRRAGKPGYAITFARLRPHDIAHFDDPAKIIAGDTRVPMCYLDNDAIAIRHVFAVAMSEFFRHASQSLGKDYSHDYNDFMDLSVEEPNGLRELRNYLACQPEGVSRQLARVVPQDLPSPRSSASGNGNGSPSSSAPSIGTAARTVEGCPSRTASSMPTSSASRRASTRTWASMTALRRTCSSPETPSRRRRRYRSSPRTESCRSTASRPTLSSSISRRFSNPSRRTDCPFPGACARPSGSTLRLRDRSGQDPLEVRRRQEAEGPGAARPQIRQMPGLRHLRLAD